MTIIFSLTAVAIVAWGFIPAIRALTDMCWPDEQRIVQEEWAETQKELDAAHEQVRTSMNAVRARLGLHRF
jgi:hypothetical protein